MTMGIARTAAGGAVGNAEAELMLTEKVQAMIELQTNLVTGALGMTPLSRNTGDRQHYRLKVAANHRRLCRTASQAAR